MQSGGKGKVECLRDAMKTALECCGQQISQLRREVSQEVCVEKIGEREKCEKGERRSAREGKSVEWPTFRGVCV